MSLLVNDLAIRIKNGYMAKRQFIDGRWSKINEEIVALLKEEGFIGNYEVIKDNTKRDLRIELKYNNNQPAVSAVRLVSKPGRRIYQKNKDIKPVFGGVGIAIYSTPSGIMTDKSAKNQSLGGELLFEIW